MSFPIIEKFDRQFNESIVRKLYHVKVPCLALTKVETFLVFYLVSVVKTIGDTVDFYLFYLLHFRINLHFRISLKL